MLAPGRRADRSEASLLENDGFVSSSLSRWLYLWSFWSSLGGLLISRAALYLGLDFNNSGAEASRDFCDVGPVAHVTVFFEVLKIGAEFV